MLFAIFFVVLALVATLSVSSSRHTTSDAIVSTFHHAGRNLASVEMSRQGHQTLPLR